MRIYETNKSYYIPSYLCGDAPQMRAHWRVFSSVRKMAKNNY